MISVLKDKNGKIYSYIEWEVLNAYGQFQDYGKFIYIQNIWIHENYRNNGVIKRFRIEILTHDFAKNAEFVYWNNLKHDRLSNTYSLKKWREGVKDGWEKI